MGLLPVIIVGLPYCLPALVGWVILVFLGGDLGGWLFALSMMLGLVGQCLTLVCSQKQVERTVFRASIALALAAGVAGSLYLYLKYELVFGRRANDVMEFYLASSIAMALTLVTLLITGRNEGSRTRRYRQPR